MNGKDVDQTEREYHEVYRQNCPSCLIGVVHHPAKSIKTDITYCVVYSILRLLHIQSQFNALAQTIS